MILVLGSGFGLYGHTAALASAGHDVATLARYRPVAEARPEIRPLLDRIRWVDESAVASAEMIALVRRPADNAAMAKALSQNVGAILVIEKPIAPTSFEAFELATELNGRKTVWAVPYLLLFSEWFALVQTAFRRGADIRISWAHQGSAHNATWKQDPGEGGGATAFYAIHACAIMASLAKSLEGVSTKAIQNVQKANVSLYLKEKSTLKIEFSLTDYSSFSIDIDGIRNVELLSPFGAIGAKGAPDPRIGALLRFYESLKDPVSNIRSPTFHDAVQRIWQKLEEV